MLRSADQATARARGAAQPSRITIGYTTSLIVAPAVRALRREHPDADVRAVHLDWNQPRGALLDHRVDAVVARLPFSTDQLHVTVLYDEPRVLLVPLDHRLAGKQSVTLDDIADEPIPQVRDCDPAWNAFWRIDPRPDGRAGTRRAALETLEDKFELIAAGRAVASRPAFPSPAPRHHHHPSGGRRAQPRRRGEPRRRPRPSRGGLSQIAAAHLTAPGRN